MHSIFALRVLTALALMLCAVWSDRSVAADAAASQAAVASFIERGMPGPAHQAMQTLAGTWDVEMELYAALGTAEQPFKAKLRAERKWVGDGRFLQDITTGSMGDSGEYWRMGVLGYNNVARHFEWVTQDAFNAGMMIYAGERGSAPSFPADMSGTFVDQGVLGEQFAGKTIAQRTVITIADNDHHTIDIYFTPPGERERLIDRKKYTRVR